MKNNFIITKYLILFLFINLVSAQSLKFVNTSGQTITIKKAKSRVLNSYSIFYLNENKYLLDNVDYKTKIVKVIKAGKFNFFPKYEEIPFDSISSFRYMKQYFSIFPMIIGGSIGYYFLAKPRADTLSFVFGTIPAYSFGFALSFLPKYSEKLTLSDGGWTVKIE